jgi:cytochrome c-type biogenesis protein
MLLPFAFVAGLVTFIDPCVIATVPVYLAYLGAQPSDKPAELVGAGAGTRTEGLSIGRAPDRDSDEAPVVVGRWMLVRRSLAFVAGFSTLFMVIGTLVIVLGRELGEWIPWMYRVGAILTILVGVAMLGWLVRPLTGFSNKLRTLPFVRSPKGAYTLGLAMSVGWIPCVGPIMAVIAGVAGLFEQIGTGIAFLALFCVGLGAPFVATAYFGESLLARLRPARRLVTGATAVAGVSMILIGGLLLHHDGYEAIEHEVEGFYEDNAPGLYEWREEEEYEEWWEHWFGEDESAEEHEEGEESE